MQKDNQLISFMQVCAIVLVVMTHAIIGLDSIVCVHAWLYSFLMPLFIFLSGYLQEYSTSKKGKEYKINVFTFIAKKAKRLLVPYFVISSLVFIPKVLLSRFADRPVQMSWYDYYHMLFYPEDNVIGPFWFLPVLFIIFCIIIVSLKINKIFNLKIPIYISLIVLLILWLINPLRNIDFLYLKKVLTYTFFFVLGMSYCKYQDFLNKILFLQKEYAAFVYFIATIISLYLFPYHLINAVQAIVGIAMSISFGYLYLRLNMKFLNHLYGASYAIYLFHWFCCTFCVQFLMSVTSISHWWASLLAFITGIYIPLLIYKFIIYSKTHYKFGKVLAFVTGH